ncbi:MAG: hypothetical protein H6Q90_2559 [Deltaproteobacteria bacterium]|nr:hypothetical protein [Deltaproteobacteria bacterium]
MAEHTDRIQPSRFNSRGIFFFSGRIQCPLAGIGSRPADASNRLVLDDAMSEVTIDREARRITVRNDHGYAKKTNVADLMFLAEGVTGSGERSPFSIHLKVQKTGHKYGVDLHRHLRNGNPMVRAEYEPYEVVAIDGGKSLVLLDQQRTDQLISKPSIALRIVKAFMAMKDNLEGQQQDPGAPGYRVADLSVGFGALGLDYMMARAQLVSLDGGNAALIERGSVPDMLREGAWEMKLTALSEKWLPEVVQRDLFLYGIDELPLLAEVRQRGLLKGQTLAFRFDRTGGTVALDDKSTPLPGALDVARAYIEFHMLGGLLAEHAESRARPPV